MKKTLCSLLFILFFSPIFSQSEYLQIGDVRNSWMTYPGSIDTATFLVTPKGLYAECQVFFDISVRCTQFTNPGDSLEIQMRFNLPKEAEVVDLWLWIYGEPVRAGIYDRWTAQQIYEGIVQRRQDPALLVKYSETMYDLRIFPLLTNMPRRIKMTFLLPINKLTAKSALVQLPLNLLKLSNCTIPTVRVAYKNGHNLNSPKLVEFPQNTFFPNNDSLFGGVHAATLLNDISNISTLTLSLNNSSFSNAYLCKNPDTTNGIYQLELNLANLLGVSQSKKTLFLIDYQSANAFNIKKHKTIQTLKNYIASYFSEGDSINFMFSDYYTTAFSSNWLSADSSSLSQIFSAIDSSDIKNFSNLPSLLPDGINFIKSTGSTGNIVLVTNSSNFSNTSDANGIINNTISFMGNPKIPVHSIYLDEMSYPNWSGNNLYYRGNEYLLSNLSVLTGGEFQSIKSFNSYYGYIYNTYEAMLNSVILKLTGHFSAINIYPAMQSGFTYADYDLSSVNGFTYFGAPYRQVGKYTGTFPMNIIISAQTPDGQLYNTQITIDTNSIINADTVSKNIWAAHYLREMLAYAQSNNVIYQVISTSINERVLTEYTAFLALEPNAAPPDPLDPDDPPITDDVLININHKESYFNITCYPNPVTAGLFFEIDLEISSKVIIEIYDVEGKKVSLIPEQQYSAGENIIEFNTDKLVPGVYFYRVIINGARNKTGKILVVK